MRVLMCNSFYYVRGGAERCFFDLSTLLEAHGHQVIPFSMRHEKNFPSPYAEYFLDYMDFPTLLGRGQGISAKLQVAERVIYSREARDKIKRLIDHVKPDVAHIHGIAHETSPSILPVLRQAGIPVVQTLHDYKLLCPNTNFIANGQVCEACKGHRYYNVVTHRCKRGSLAASLLAGVEMYTHKAMQIYERNINTFISPSQFLKAKVEEYGIQNPGVYLPNFIEVESFQPVYDKDDYFVYYGRLVDVKGVRTLLQAMRGVKISHLYIAGTGELEAELKGYAQQHGITNVTFLGQLDKERLIPLVQRARFTIVPSEWYENCPMTVLESFASGTPVIGAQIGGIPELVHDGENGALFAPGNAQQLAESIHTLLAQPARTAEMGRAGRAQVLQYNNPDYHYERTLAIYSDLLR